MAKLIVLLSLAAYSSAHYSASNLARNIYDECLSQYSVECVKPRTLQWISQVANNDEIKITNDLSIVRTATIEEDSNVDPRMAKDLTYAMFDKVDSFLQTHTLRVKVPEEITKSAASEYVPRSLLFNLPSELDMPLDGEEEVETFEGRKKKIKLPKPLRIKSSTYIFVMFEFFKVLFAFYLPSNVCFIFRTRFHQEGDPAFPPRSQVQDCCPGAPRTGPYRSEDMEGSDSWPYFYCSFWYV